MADDKRLTTDRFYGGTSHRIELLKQFLSFVAENNPTRSQAKDWILSNTQARSRDAIDHHLGFLDAVKLIKLDDGNISIGYRGQQYLTEPTPSVLYETLRSNVKGFDTILRRLQSGPMTDDDIMDVLVMEFEDINMDSPGVAARHREWLQVLGYVERSDGINQLTEAGQELATMLGREGSSLSTLSDVPPTDEGWAEVPPSGELPSGNQTTKRREATRENIVRDETLIRRLKNLYEETCQICGDRRLQGQNEGFSHVHHLMPLGKPHNGPDTPENVLVVCPNHHEDFENGMLSIDPQTLEIDHYYEDEVSGRTIETRGDHDIGPQYLAYHNQVRAEN